MMMGDEPFISLFHKEDCKTRGLGIEFATDVTQEIVETDGQHRRVVEHHDLTLLKLDLVSGVDHDREVFRDRLPTYCYAVASSAMQDRVRRVEFGNGHVVICVIRGLPSREHGSSIASGR